MSGAAQVFDSAGPLLSAGAHTGPLMATFDRLGDALKALRLDAALTQEELADRADVRRVSVSDWERGAKPGTEALEKILVALGVDLYDLAVALDRVNNREPRLVTASHRRPVVPEEATTIAQLILPGAPPEDLEDFVRISSEIRRLERNAAALRRKWPDEWMREGLAMRDLPRAEMVNEPGTQVLPSTMGSDSPEVQLERALDREQEESEGELEKSLADAATEGENAGRRPAKRGGGHGRGPG